MLPLNGRDQRRSRSRFVFIVLIASDNADTTAKLYHAHVPRRVSIEEVIGSIAVAVVISADHERVVLGPHILEAKAAVALIVIRVAFRVIADCAGSKPEASVGVGRASER